MSASEREIACAVPAVPPGLAEAVRGYFWARDTIGESGGSVYRLHGHARRPNLYLKQGAGSVADDIADELARLNWLKMHVPVPRVLHFEQDGDAAWLLMEAIPGRTAYQCLEDEPKARVAIVAALARFMTRLHAVPVDTCPFNSDHRLRLALAEQRMEAGLVDAEDFDEERLGSSPVEVWQEMRALLPLTPDPVVTHGDFSLDNILLNDGEVTGCIDVGRAGIADRYQDIAILWNGLGEFGQELQSHFLNSYGVDSLDRRKLDFHLMLDEFF